MSVSISSACWSLQLPPGPKLVLLCLADFANDEGACWPSVATLCELTGFGERAVQGHLKALEAAGVVARKDGRGRSCMFQIRPDAMSQDAQPPQDLHPRRIRTPAESAPLPRRICAPPPQNLRGSPAESAPDPSLIHQRSTIDPPKRARAPEVSLPEWIDRETWETYARHRREIRASLTGEATKRLLLALDRMRQDGQDPNLCLLQSVQNGWRGVFPLKEVSHGTNRHRPQPQSLLDRVRAACDEQQARFEALAANGRALRPQVDVEHGPEPERVVVEGRFRVV